eukprot:6046596-Alexandrium_andersonii.AAC.1
MAGQQATAAGPGPSRWSVLARQAAAAADEAHSCANLARLEQMWAAEAAATPAWVEGGRALARYRG